MVNDPNVDDLIEKLGEVEGGEPVSKYALCVITAKRARQIIEREHNGSANTIPPKEKEVVVACKEIMEGKITYTKD